MSTEEEPTFACEALLGKVLEGNRKQGKWHIVERYERSPDATGGTFSVGYRAVHDDGTQAFLKATDLGFLSQLDDDISPLDKLRQAANEHAFEREILDICRGSNMDRVVHALDYGEVESREGGVRDYVFYILFELASGDVRQQVLRNKRRNLSWSTHALHNLSVAIQQLHTAKIAHNDVKPSNLLVFDEFLQKLADLGRATSAERIGPWDGLNYTGDYTYAAPEFWYHDIDFPRVSGKIDFGVRRASDLYLLGSMGFFFVAGVALTPLLIKQMREEHLPHSWGGSFQDVLPYVRDAVGRSMEFFDAELPKTAQGDLIHEAEELRAAVLQLCDPDPRRRGHPRNVGGRSQYSVERYIALFDRLAKRLAVRERLLV
jgi:serine/threonine protein kinase